MPIAPRAAPLALVALVAFVMLSCASGAREEGAAPCPDSAQPITHGPRVGAVTGDTARIWARACRPVDISVQYKTAGQAWDAAAEAGPATADPAADYTAVIEITGLQPASAYDVRLVVDGEVPASAPDGRFETMPEPGSPVSFLLVQDLHPSGEPLVGFDQASALPTDFALVVGDLIDIEPLPLDADQPTPAPPSPSGAEDYLALYRTAWADPHFRAFMAGRATYMMWDDHEILNDWDRGASPPYPWARAAFEAYQGSANPQPIRAAELYYIVRAGDVELFLLDTRSHRSPNEQRDGEQKTMLGAQQKADLKAWLLGSRAKFKIIVSSVAWSDFAAHVEEAWRSFSTERDELFDYIRLHQVSGVVLLSGDEHWAGVIRNDPWGLYEMSATPVGGYAGLTGRFTLLPDERILFKQGWTHNFGQVQVDATSCPARLVLRIIDLQGLVLYELPLTEIDVDGGTSSPEDYCAALAQGQLDSDGDGCRDAEERGDDARRGGRRDPHDRWDFYDVNGDRRVDARDAITVARALGAVSGDGRYDPILDRSRPAGASQPEDLGPPDGVINMDDFFLVLGQAGHACLGMS
jgi:alkaline phosphatase D